MKHYACTTEEFISLKHTLLPLWDDIVVKFEKVEKTLPVQNYRHSPFSTYEGTPVVSFLEYSNAQKRPVWEGIRKDLMPRPNTHILFPMFR